MSVIFVTVVSIIAISGAIAAARKLLNVPLCPICLGVGGTWLWMLVGRSMGYAFDTTMLPVLLGGSVVGIAYQVEKRLPKSRSSLLWKMLFVPTGFTAAYALTAAQWKLSVVMVVALVSLTAFFLRSPGAPEQKSEAVKRLEQKMRECC